MRHTKTTAKAASPSRRVPARGGESGRTKTQAKPDAPASVDDYVAAFPPDVRRVLSRIRAVARKAAPSAEEILSYRMPALRLNGILVYYAAFKKHIGLFPPISGDEGIEMAIAPYAGPKGNLKFPLDEPIPYDLIGNLVRLRVRQDAETAKRKKAARGSAARRKKASG